MKAFLIFLFLNSSILKAAPLSNTNFPDYLRGGIVPLVTPYKGENASQIDENALIQFVDYLCTTKVSALFVVSGTGQWPLLSMEEKKKLISLTVATSKKRKPVLAGIGSVNYLEEELEMARFAESVGADAVVAVTPDFIREQQPLLNGEKRITDQSILINYYSTLADAVKIPFVIYDPQAEVEPSTLNILLTQHQNIKGIKYREKKMMSKFGDLVSAAQGRMAILSGSENFALGAMKEGAVGFIGNGLNLYPNLADDFYQAVKKKNWTKAEQLQKKMSEANEKMEQLGGGAQGIKKILHDVIGINISTANRGDQFKSESFPGQFEEILTYFSKLGLPSIHQQEN